jgi:hypothetical protein
MGTKMAPSYANIFMGKLEKLIIQSAPHNDKWHSFVRVLFFILDEVFSVNTTCFVKTMVNARIVVTPLFQMTFQFPRPFFGGLFVGADAFDSESLAVRNTFGAMLRMTTLWGQVLMFICRFVGMATEAMQIANLPFYSADISDRRATMILSAN